MEHSNPILMGNNSPQKFITIGEVMLRLTPPNYEKIRMASAFEASYGGSEANIALALANLGVDSTFFSVVPNNSLGKSAVRWLRCNDVHCTPMILSTKEETPSHRLGTYYLETGYGIRPSKVIYDRMHSALTEYDLTKVDLDELFDGFDWLHLSGITPALNKNCADFILRCLRAAKEKGLTVSFDGNFRSTLWSWEEARDYCTQCLPYVDVLFGIEPYHLWKDDEDHSKGDWKDGVPLQPSYEQQDEIFQHFIDRYPNLKCIARHVRYVHSGSENSLKAFMWYEGHTFESKLYTFNILDRVGAAIVNSHAARLGVVELSAGEADVRNIAREFVLLLRGDKVGTAAIDGLPRLVKVEQRGAKAVHVAIARVEYAMVEEQPALTGLDGDGASTNLHALPGAHLESSRSHNMAMLAPEAHVGRLAVEDVAKGSMASVRGTREHGVVAINLLGEEYAVAVVRQESVLELMEGHEVGSPGHADGRAVVAVAPGNVVLVLYLAHAGVVAVHPVAYLLVVALEA